MARDTDHLAGNLDTEYTGGFLTGFLAEEDEFDRRAMWRLGSWGVASVGAVIVALYANQSSIGLRREQFAAADLARQSQQIQSVAKESASETRRLTSAIDTLNGDRDRLYSRVTVLEQGLDSLTGAIARQSSGATSPQAAAVPAASEPQLPSQNPAPVVSPVATTAAKAGDKPATDAVVPEQAPATVASVAQPTANAPAATPSTPLMAAKSMMAPPDPAAGKLIEPAGSPNTVASAPMPDVEASVAPADEADLEQADAPKSAVQRTEFGVDIGGANSLPGLRALWRGLLKSKSNSALAALRPIIVVRESNTGLGMQLRLVAGPLVDAAAAAKICAAMTESKRACETAVFDGQRLTMKADEAPAVAKPTMRKRSTPKGAAADEPAKKPESSTLSSLLGRVRGGQ
jgi:hypothetical protein